MKHIKLFMESFSNEEYYTPVSRHAYDNCNRDIFENFTSDEIKFFKNNDKFICAFLYKDIVKNPYTFKRIDDTKEDNFDSNFVLSHLQSGLVARENRDYIFSVYKMKDEYYMVRIFLGEIDEYYKCDQWEGFIQLLKDKKII
jgi:hypothetical protein